MKWRKYILVISLFFVIAPASAQNGRGEILEWKYGNIIFSGAYYQGKPGMPGVLIFHQWMGLSDHEKEAALELNRLGYTVLSADLYGKGNNPADRAGAAKIAGTFYQDRQKLRSHAIEAFKALSAKSKLKSADIYAIGYCFGGTAALELARTGTRAAGFVSLHGGLANPNPGDDGKIRGRVMILHGAEDQSVPMTDVTSMIENFRKHKKDFSVHIFSGAVHGFTHKHDRERYNKEADESSWRIMTDFFKGN